MTKVNPSFTILLIVMSAFCATLCDADLPTITVLHTFAPAGHDDLIPAHHANLDGAQPEAPLVQGIDGALYGAMSSGGANGTGVIFKVNSDGTGYAVLHSFGPVDSLFTNDTNSDGCRPSGAMVFGKGGALYGITAMGGPKGSGTVFKLNTDGSGFTVLHSLEPKGELYHNSGGAAPLGLTVGADGTLVGVAELGGDGRGLIFKLAQDGKQFHVIHAFGDPPYDDNSNKEGSIPGVAVVIGPDSTLYGTTNIGGSEGCGVIYRMDADGSHFTGLHNFRRKGGDYKNNGMFPNGSLVCGPNNFLYGCTRQGGAFDGGIVYKMSTDGAMFTVLHTFSAPNSDNGDGSLPNGPLAVGSDGYLYGLSGVGGETGLGTLFKVSTNGAKFFALHDFTAAEGGYARAGLTLGRDGSLYGVSTGGANGSGTIFRVSFPRNK